MIQTIDERRDIEGQIVRNLCLEIGRGAYREGELLPAPESLASDLLVNPWKVTAAYRRLCNEEIVTFVKGRGYLLQTEAPARARARLLEAFRVDLAAAISELRKAGCSSTRLQTVMQSALAKETEAVEKS